MTTIAIVLLSVTHRARAQSCSLTAASLSLGLINPFATVAAVTSGTATVTCSTLFPVTIYTCLSIGVGSGGTSFNRTLSLGGAKMSIDINSGGASAQIGDGTTYPMYGPLVFSLGLFGNASQTIPIAVTLPTQSPAPAPGTYGSTFAGADFTLFYNTGSSGISCAALKSGNMVSQSLLAISATVPAQCTVSASSLVFPTTSILGAAVNATATVSVICNAGTAVTLALDNGATGTGPTARKMRFGANSIAYGIYRDAAATQPWGNTPGTDTASLPSGSGNLTAYGRVPPQPSPAPGLYSDVVNVTISY